MASPTMPVTCEIVEDRRFDNADARREAVKKLDRVPLHMAKVQVGVALRQAIGPLSMKQFGDAGLISAICAGDKVPDYLALIHQNPDTRRRFALAWLAGDIDEMNFTMRRTG